MINPLPGCELTGDPDQVGTQVLYGITTRQAIDKAVCLWPLSLCTHLRQAWGQAEIRKATGGPRLPAHGGGRAVPQPQRLHLVATSAAYPAPHSPATAPRPGLLAVHAYPGLIRFQTKNKQKKTKKQNKVLKVRWSHCSHKYLEVV